MHEFARSKVDFSQSARRTAEISLPLYCARFVEFRGKEKVFHKHFSSGRALSPDMKLHLSDSGRRRDGSKIAK